MFDSDTLIKNLKHLLGKNEITAYRLSKDSNVPEVTLNKILRGETVNPTISSLYKIADYFGCTLDELVGRSTTSSESESAINLKLLQASLDILEQELDGEEPEMTLDKWCATLKEIYEGIKASSEARLAKKTLE